MSQHASRRRTRGMVLAAVGIALAAFLALAVVAVDLGRLGFTATEVQTVADVAATAGATAVFNGANPVAQAQSVVGLNLVDGRTATIDAGDIAVGNYNFTNASFTVGGVPANAVRANARATVSNLLAAILRTPTTTVQKTATAAVTAVGSALPELPLAIGSCYFSNLCPTCLPTLITAPTSSNGMGGPNNTAFTSFFSNNASTGGVEQYFPPPCNGMTTPASPPQLSLGDQIRLNNGNDTNWFRDAQCLLDNGLTRFVVPVFQSDNPNDCGTPNNQSKAVVGFVTLEIFAVQSQGNPKYISTRVVPNANVPGRPGGLTGTGSGMAVLVN